MIYVRARVALGQIVRITEYFKEHERRLSKLFGYTIYDSGSRVLDFGREPFARRKIFALDAIDS